MPDRDGNSYKSHGTRCAGEIIMQPNNGICGVGTAYGASIGGAFLDLQVIKCVIFRAPEINAL